MWLSSLLSGFNVQADRVYCMKIFLFVGFTTAKHKSPLSESRTICSQQYSFDVSMFYRLVVLIFHK